MEFPRSQPKSSIRSADIPKRARRASWIGIRRVQKTLILTRFADTNQVHLVRQPGGARTQLTFFPDRVNNASFDPVKGDFFLFSKSAGGNEFNQNYRYDFATGEITLLTDGKARNSDPDWSTTGNLSPTPRPGATARTPTFTSQSPRDPKTDRLLAEVKGGGWQIGRLVAGRQATCS